MVRLWTISRLLGYGALVVPSMQQVLASQQDRVRLVCIEPGQALRACYSAELTITM